MSSNCERCGRRIYLVKCDCKKHWVYWPEYEISTVLYSCDPESAIQTWLDQIADSDDFEDFYSGVGIWCKSDHTPLQKYNVTADAVIEYFPTQVTPSDGEVGQISKAFYGRQSGKVESEVQK